MTIKLILAETNRSFFYLDKLFKENIPIRKIFYYSKKKGKVYYLIKKKKLIDKTKHFLTNNINDKKISKSINKFNELGGYIFSGYEGQIVKNTDLIKNNLIHCHSGDLPEFKGSTTIYYTILSRKKICVSLIYLNQKIDEGRIIFKKYFRYPKNKIIIEKNYDNKIRAETLCKFLKIKKAKHFTKTKNIRKLSYNYYIAHPLVRFMALNENFLKNYLIKRFK